MKQNRIIATYILALLFITLAVFTFSTKHGLGIFPDSVRYLEAAENFSKNREIATEDGPLTHLPPFYSISIGIFSPFFNNSLIAAKYLQLIFYVLSSLLIFIAVYKTSNDSITTGALASLFFIFSPSSIYRHTRLMSEAEFLCIVLLIILTTASYLNKNSRRTLLTLSALLPLAILTRYIGIAIFFSTIAATFILDRENKKNTKLLNIFILATPTILIIPLWLLRNKLTGNSIANRSFSVHLADLTHLESILQSIASFFIPLGQLHSLFRNNSYITLTLLLALVLSLFFARKNKQEENTNNVIVHISLLFCAFYTLLLLFSISFFDRYTPLNERILFPINGVLLICFSSAIFSLKKIVPKKPFMVLIAALLLINTACGVRITKALNKNGHGYSAPKLNDSKLLEHIRFHINKDLIIYSNAFDSIRFILKRNAKKIPKKYYATSGLKNKNFDVQMAQLEEQVREKKAVIIYFNSFNWRKQLPTKEEIEKETGFSNWCEIAEEGSYINFNEKKCS